MGGVCMGPNRWDQALPQSRDLRELGQEIKLRLELLQIPLCLHRSELLQALPEDAGEVSLRFASQPVSAHAAPLRRSNSALTSSKICLGVFSLNPES